MSFYVQTESQTGGLIFVRSNAWNSHDVGIKWEGSQPEFLEEYYSLPLALMRFALLIDIEENGGEIESQDTFTRYAEAVLDERAGR